MSCRLPTVFAIVCLALAASPAAAQPFVGSVHVPIVDYPAGARPGARPFEVRLRFVLAPSGAVTGCTTARSSGVAALDAESCRILEERARLRPARGRSTGVVRFVWQNEPPRGPDNPTGAPLPFGFIEQLSADDYPADAIENRAQGAVDYEVDVSEHGVALACRVARSSGSASLDRRTCLLVMERAIFIAASDGRGGRRAGTFSGRLTWRQP